MPYAMHEVIIKNTAIADDDDPNDTPPAQGRDVELPPLPAGSGGSLVVFAIDGTTISVVPYLYESQTQQWLPLVAAPVAVVPAAPSIIPVPGLDRGARVFMRCSTNTAVTKLAWRCGPPPAVDGGAAQPVTVESLPLPNGAATQATLAALLAASQSPGSLTPITPSDGTDVSTTASIGLWVTADGNLTVRGVNTPSTNVTKSVVAGEYVWGHFSRVMAATTATVVGLAP